MELPQPSAVEKFRVTQLYALLTLWYSTKGEDWEDNDGWLIKENECTWYGITCTKLKLEGSEVAQDMVTKVLLFSLNTVDNDNNLVGSIPADIALLQNIEDFNAFGQKGLSGTLPSSLKALTKMEEFSVQGCDLSGSLPEGIGDWKNLKEFHV